MQGKRRDDGIVTWLEAGEYASVADMVTRRKEAMGAYMRPRLREILVRLDALQEAVNDMDDLQDLDVWLNHEIKGMRLRVERRLAAEEEAETRGFAPVGRTDEYSPPGGWPRYAGPQVNEP